MGFKMEDVKELDPKTVMNILEGPPLWSKEAIAPYPDGTLIRLKGKVQTYVIRGGRKCYIPDPETFQAWGFQWDQVLETDQNTFNKIPKGIPLASIKPPYQYGPPGIPPPMGVPGAPLYPPGTYPPSAYPPLTSPYPQPYPPSGYPPQSTPPPQPYPYPLSSSPQTPSSLPSTPPPPPYQQPSPPPSSSLPSGTSSFIGKSFVTQSNLHLYEIVVSQLVPYLMPNYAKGVGLKGLFPGGLI